jgi:DNA-directed RNA polymerase subunit RPC12/RpoP
VLVVGRVKLGGNMKNLEIKVIKEYRNSTRIRVKNIITKDIKFMSIPIDKNINEFVMDDFASTERIENKCVNVLYDCSKCGENIDFTRFHGEPIKYCPNCGKKFKEEK